MSENDDERLRRVEQRAEAEGELKKYTISGRYSKTVLQSRLHCVDFDSTLQIRKSESGREDHCHSLYLRYVGSVFSGFVIV